MRCVLRLGWLAQMNCNGEIRGIRRRGELQTSPLAPCRFISSSSFSAPLRAVAHVLPVPCPFFAPGKGKTALLTKFVWQIPFFEVSRHGFNLAGCNTRDSKGHKKARARLELFSRIKRKLATFGEKVADFLEQYFLARWCRWCSILGFFGHLLDLVYRNDNEEIDTKCCEEEAY